MRLMKRVRSMYARNQFAIAELVDILSELVIIFLCKGKLCLPGLFLTFLVGYLSFSGYSGWKLASRLVPKRVVRLF